MALDLQSPRASDAPSAPTGRRYHLVQVTTFAIDELDDLLTLLSRFREQHATGTLTLEISQGGVRAIHFREETRAFVER
jgi:hypothetical protein